MGFYIETSASHGKAEEIAEKYDGVICNYTPDYIDKTRKGYGIIVVIDNGPFEAAGFAFSEQEYNAFLRPGDLRPKKFVVLNRETAERASGYRRD